MIFGKNIPCFRVKRCTYMVFKIFSFLTPWRMNMVAAPLLSVFSQAEPSTYCTSLLTNCFQPKIERGLQLFTEQYPYMQVCIENLSTTPHPPFLKGVKFWDASHSTFSQVNISRRKYLYFKSHQSCEAWGHFWESPSVYVSLWNIFTVVLPSIKKPHIP